VEIDQDLVERQGAGQNHAPRVEALGGFDFAAPLQRDTHDIADALTWADDRGFDHRLFDLIDARHVRQLHGIVQLQRHAVFELHAVHNRRMRVDDVQVELAAQPFLHHLHVQQAQESTTEAEAQRDRTLGMEREGGVVQVQFLQSGTDLLKLVGADRIDAAEHHRPHLFEAGQQLGCPVLGPGHRVPDLNVGRIFDRTDQVPHLSGLEHADRLLIRTENAHFAELRDLATADVADRVASLDAAVHHTHIGDYAAKLIEDGIKHQRPQRRVGTRRFRGRDAGDDRLQHLRHAQPGLGTDVKRMVHRDAQHVFDLVRDLLDVRAGQIHLVEHRHDLQLIVDRQIGVRDRLRLDALCGIDHEHRAFARAHASRHFIVEVHVARRVDQVEQVRLAVLGGVGHGNRVRFDRDAALAL